MYTIPARRQNPSPSDEERRKGLCHLCKRKGHIQRYCPRKTPEQPARIAHTRATPLAADQGMKRPRSPTLDGDNVIRYLKRTTPENRNEVAAGLMTSTTRQDFFPCLSKLAFARAIKSDVFLPNLNAMRIPVTLHTVLRPSTRRSRCRISVSRAFVEDKGTQRSSLLSCLARAEPRRLAWLYKFRGSQAIGLRIRGFTSEGNRS